MARCPTPSGIPRTLAQFGSLPDEAYVDTSTVGALLDMSRATIARRVQAGDLPEPKRFGRTPRFNVGALRRALGA